MLVVFAGEPVTTLEAILGEELEAKTIAVNFVREIPIATAVCPAVVDCINSEPSSRTLEYEFYNVLMSKNLPQQIFIKKQRFFIQIAT